uniref:C-type lectin domain-containing protein n=1 Tax=Acrobeloides nanus TaxID=290746 RepID=A0A914CSJ1_9BILA
MIGSLASITSSYVQKWLLNTLTTGWNNCSISVGSCVGMNGCPLGGMCMSDGNCTMKLNSKTRFWLNAYALCNEMLNNFTTWNDNTKIVYTNWAIGQPNYACFDECQAIDAKKIVPKISSMQLLEIEHNKSHKISWNSGSGTGSCQGDENSMLCLQMELGTGQWYASDCFESLYGAFCMYKTK